MDLQEVSRGGYSSPTPTAPLQPYLCSVPEDLHHEKDYLRTHVFPHLDALCRSRGSCFRPVDLQWNDGEVGSGDQGEGLSRHLRPPISQRLKLSLDHVDRSPFFLCLLGHLYGQCRPEGEPPLPANGTGREGLSDLERNLCLAGRSGYPWVLHGRNQTCSLTELEITQAVRMKEPRAAFFYFRDYSFPEEEGDALDERQRALLLKVWTSQTEYKRGRMRELKTWIVDGCLPVRFFRSVEELGDLVTKDWSRVIQQLYPLDALSKHLGQHWCCEGFVEERLQRFVPWSQATQVFDNLDSFALSVTCDNTTAPPPGDTERQPISDRHSRGLEKSILLLCGARGCGKSSLVAWWLQEFRKKHPELPVFSQFPGLCPSSTDVRSLLRQCIFLLRQAHYGPQAEWSERLEERVEPRPVLQMVQDFYAAGSLGPCVLVLDGLDQLTGTLGLSTQQVKELQWLPDALPPRCKLIATTTSTDLSYKSLTCRRDVWALNCPSQSDPVTRQSVLLSHLALPCKDLPGPLLENISGRKLIAAPLFLAILGTELRTCGVLREEEEEEELVEEYLEVDSVPELWAKVIQRWIDDYSWVSSRKPKKRRTVPSSSAPNTELQGWVWDALCLLHLSYSGLSPEEVLSLLEELGYTGARRVLPLNWALFHSAAGPWVAERPNGQLTFTHQSLSQAVDLLLLKVRQQPEGYVTSRGVYHRALAQFFWKRTGPASSPASSPAFSPASMARALEEVPWSLEQSKAWADLHSFLTDPSIVHFLSRIPGQSHLKTDVVRYWSLLTRASYDPYTSYQNLLCQVDLQPRDKSGGRQDTAVVTGDTEVGEREKDVNGTFITEVAGDGEGKFNLVPRYRPAFGMPSVEKHIAEGGDLQGSEVGGRLMAFSAEVLLCLGRRQEAEMMLQQAESLLKQAERLDRDATRLLLNVQHSLTELYIHMHQPHGAEVHCRRALDVAEALTAAHPDETEDAQRARGQLLCKLCQMLLVIGCFDEVPRILKEIRAVNHTSSHPCAEATVKLLQGIYELGHGDVTAAEKCFRVALANRRRWYGTEHQLVADAEEHLADVLEQTHRETGFNTGPAVDLYQHVIHIKTQEVRLHPMTSPLARPIGCSLADTLVKLGKLLLVNCSRADRRTANSILQRALDLRIRLLGPEHRQTREISQILRTEMHAVPGPRTAQTPRRAGTSSERSPWLEGRDGRCSSRSAHRALTATPSRYQSRPARGPSAACRTTAFSPQSNIGDLNPCLRAGPLDRARVLHKTAWYHLPGTYSITQPHKQIHHYTDRQVTRYTEKETDTPLQKQRDRCSST